MERVKILVVEDEVIIAKDIQMSLQQLGYSVPSTVVSGEQAIRKAEGEKPDLIIMDIVLQGEMDGIETASIIRSRFDIPIIYLTSYSDKNTQDRAKATEPYGYILKPFEETLVDTTIKMALLNHKMEKRLRESEKEAFSTP
jgi:CheY-like chemotaxis protein